MSTTSTELLVASQSAYTDDVDAAEELARNRVQVTAEQNGWTAEELAGALADVASARDAAGWFSAFMSASIGVSVGEEQVSTFWTELADKSYTWGMSGADELHAAFSSAAGTAERAAEESVSTPLDVVDTYVVEPTVETAEDIREAGETVVEAASSPWFLPVLGAFALLGVVVAVKVK